MSGCVTQIDNETQIMTPITNQHNAEFIRAAYAAAESPVGGEYTRMYLREALRRLEISEEIIREGADHE